MIVKSRECVSASVCVLHNEKQCSPCLSCSPSIAVALPVALALSRTLLPFATRGECSMCICESDASDDDGTVTATGQQRKNVFDNAKKKNENSLRPCRPRDVVDEFHHKQTAPLLRARRVCFFVSVREEIRIQSQSDQKLVRSVVGQGKNRVLNQKKQEKNSGFVRGEDDSGVFINGIYFDINL